MPELLDTIARKVTELNSEQAHVSQRLQADKELLIEALANAALGDTCADKDLEKLRAAIATQERRIEEIDGILRKLADRRKAEEARIRVAETEKVKKALKQIDLECYRVYREELVCAKATAEVLKKHAALKLRREQEVAKLAVIGVEVPFNAEVFVVSNRWYEEDPDAKTGLGRAMTGQMPWQDIETDAGMNFINEEVCRLEKEVGR